MILEKVISGGQSGADQGGLEGARHEGVETGGWAPKGFITEEGPREILLCSVYDLQEHRSAEYPPRTKQNVLDSDGTVIFGSLGGRGSRLTERYCTENSKPYLLAILGTARGLADFIEEHQIKVLNVAGHRASTHPDIYRVAKTSVAGAIRILRYRDKINETEYNVSKE